MKETRDILVLFEALNNHEIFTPPKLARQMLELLPDEVWTNPSLRFLDPCTKSGVFLREIFYKLYEGLKDKGYHTAHDGVDYNLNNGQERINHILKNMIYGIATSELTGYIARRTLYGVMEANTDKQIAAIDSFVKSDNYNQWSQDEQLKFVDRNKFNEYYNYRMFNTNEYKGFEEEGNIFYPANEVAKKVLEDGNYEIEDTYYPFINEETKHQKILDIKEGRMKFDVIIGNPPYQISDGGSGTGISAKPLYHVFIQKAKSLRPKYLSMIVPSRWFAGGKGLNTFRDEMINDNRMEYIYDFSNSKDCFPGVNIAGGVNYFLWNFSHKGSCNVVNVNKEVSTKTTRPLNEYSIFIRDNMAIQISKSIKVKTNDFMNNVVLSRNPFGFVSKDRGLSLSEKNTIKLFHSQGVGYVSADDIKRNKDLVDKYKVTIGKVVPSNGEVDVTPEMGYRVITTPKIYKEKEIFTESYLLLNSFDTETEAKNFAKYITLKLPRFLLKQALTSMNISKEAFVLVPVVDWEQNWTDESLYDYFSLNEHEINHVESVMKPIEMK